MEFVLPTAGPIQHTPLETMLEQHRSLANIFPHHFGCIDESGCYTYWNPHSEKMFGYCAQEVIGIRGSDIIFATRGMAQEIMQAVEEKGIFNDEVVLRHRDGCVFPARLAIIPLKKTAGKAMPYYEFAQDISEFKITKKEIEDLKAALRVLLHKMEEEKKEYRDNLLAMLNQSIMPHLKQIQHDSTDPRILASIKSINANIDYFKTNCFSTLQANAYELTPTEVEVSRLVAGGTCTKDIARRLNISAETVAFHRKNIRRKLGICNRKINLCSHIASLKR
jgi:PAS domain S-box-containing protein